MICHRATHCLVERDTFQGILRQRRSREQDQQRRDR
jgi:hypothetical protein